MKKISFILFLSLFYSFGLFAQSAADIAKFTAKFKQENEYASVEMIQFSVDTFKIYRKMEADIVADGSTAGMNQATATAYDAYDRLLNKYYKLLLGKLAKKDQSLLVETQKAWLKFRDNELLLKQKLCDDKYSGGGSIQSLFYSSFRLGLVEQRSIEIFNHFNNLISE